MKKTVIIFMLFLLVAKVSGQQECAFILQEAQDMFDAGLIETIPEELSACLKSGFTEEEKLQAYKLIILSYLFDDNIEKADEFMFRFLSDYPAYEVVATDPREFVLLMETYDTDPVLMIGGGVGANFSFPLVGEQFGVHNNGRFKGNFSPGGAGFQGAFMVEKGLGNGLSLKAGLAFYNNVFDIYLDDASEVIEPAAEVTDFSVIDFYETQNRLQLPLGVAWRFHDGDFSPTVSLGISPGILLTSGGEARREYLNSGYDPVSVANVNLNEGRRFLNIWATAGAGVSYHLGPGEAFLNLDMHVNLLNQVKPGSDRYMFDKLVWEAYYVNDDYYLNYLTVTAGYLFPLYRPKKKE